MTLLVTAVAMAGLFIPGLACVHWFARGYTPETKFAIAPAVSVVLLAGAALVGWICPAYFVWISLTCVAGATAIGLAMLAVTRGLRIVRSIDPVLPLAYVHLALFSTQLSLLPIQASGDISPAQESNGAISRAPLPAHIQALHGGLSNHNVVPYRFAELLLHRGLLQSLDKGACGKTPADSSRPLLAEPPILPLVGAHFVNLFGAVRPADQQSSTRLDMDREAAYYPFFLAAACMNALCILPAYLIAFRMAGRLAARLTVLLIACNCGMVLHTNDMSPQGLAGYFGLLLAHGVLTGSILPGTMGCLLALSIYCHPCAMGLGIGCCVYHLAASANRRESLLQLAKAGSVMAALLLPWCACQLTWRDSPLNLLLPNLYAYREWSLKVDVRVVNVFKTLFPQFAGASLSVQALLDNALRTLPGMLGLGLVPFFAVSLGRPGARRIALAIGLMPLLYASFISEGGQGGLALVGPWLFIPIAIGLSCAVLSSLPRWACLAVGLTCIVEQALVTWLAAYASHSGPFPTGDWHAPARLIALVGLQLLAAAITTSVCLRRYSWPGAGARANRRVICPSFKPQPVNREIMPLEVGTSAFGSRRL
jgi:hypothetical protein